MTAYKIWSGSDKIETLGQYMTKYYGRIMTEDAR